MKKILITGSKGMLAHDFINNFTTLFEIIAFDKEELDITSYITLENTIKKYNPDIIINFAAYTNVEDAEDIGFQSNYEINTLGVYYLAKLTSKYNIDIITFSTDYVFNGLQSEGYREDEKPCPINSYGMAKYLGEKLALQENINTIIIRTSWLYGGGADFKNFVNTMISLSKKNKSIRVVNDQFGSPTYTVDLLESLVKVIDSLSQYRGKILHFSNNVPQEGITWFNFAQEIFIILNKKVELIPCSSNDFPSKLKRPQHSSLINNSIKLRDWKQGLNAYIKTLL